MNAQLAIQPAGLPDEGERIEFILDGRDVAIDGTYIQRTFRSRWSGYTVEARTLLATRRRGLIHRRTPPRRAQHEKPPMKHVSPANKSAQSTNSR